MMVLAKGVESLQAVVAFSTTLTGDGLKATLGDWCM
jgi:hypothetical protein